MKRLLMAIAFLFVAAPILAQPVIQAGQGFGFDYRASDITTAGVVRFELQIDNGAWTNVQMPPVVTATGTQAGHETRRIDPPAITQGNHTFSVRACSATACSAAMTAVPFRVEIVPPPTTNGRLLPPTP